jgi:hypothetical protein
MKTLSLLSDQDEIDTLFQSIIFQKYNVVLWQKPQGDNAKRKVLFTQLEKSEDFLQFAPSTESDFNFEEDLDVFFYCQDVGMIFKGPMIPEDDQRPAMDFPQECKLLNQEDASSYIEMVDAFQESFIDNIGRPKNDNRPRISLSENASFKYAQTHMIGKMAGTDNVGDEIVKVSSGLSMEDIPYSEAEEKKYAGKREAPRARPKVQKKVHIRKNQDKLATEYALFDLSQGGLSFIIKNQNAFQKGEEIEIDNLDQRELDPPLKGKVMSIRPVDDTTQHKVGVMFLEEQES